MTDSEKLEAYRVAKKYFSIPPIFRYFFPKESIFRNSYCGMCRFFLDYFREPMKVYNSEDKMLTDNPILHDAVIIIALKNGIDSYSAIEYSHFFKITANRRKGRILRVKALDLTIKFYEEKQKNEC